MKIITITFCAAILLCACNSEEKKANETKEASKVAVVNETKTDPVPDSMLMKNWQAYMTPGKEHQLMASWDGVWNGSVTTWNNPGSPPSTSTMEVNNKMVLGGRYQQSTYKGTMMGQPFEGISTTGFDNAKKEFVSTWEDNMGTGIAKASGPWDEASKSVTLTGNMMEGTSGKEVGFREILKIVDEDHQIMEMYGPGADGKEFKTMEIKYTRKK